VRCGGGVGSQGSGRDGRGGVRHDAAPRLGTWNARGYVGCGGVGKGGVSTNPVPT
jgi:hypothetical protein